MSASEFAALPSECAKFVWLTRRGFRDQTIIVVTTLLDAKRYSARQLTVVWTALAAAEVNLRHLKTTLKWRC